MLTNTVKGSLRANFSIYYILPWNNQNKPFLFGPTRLVSILTQAEQIYFQKMADFYKFQGCKNCWNLLSVYLFLYIYFAKQASEVYFCFPFFNTFELNFHASFFTSCFIYTIEFKLLLCFRIGFTFTIFLRKDLLLSTKEGKKRKQYLFLVILDMYSAFQSFPVHRHIMLWFRGILS